MEKHMSFKPKGLLFDVFGTVVDWRTTIVAKLQSRFHERLNSPAESLPSTVRRSADDIPWNEIAQKWRDSYKDFTQNYSSSSSADNATGFKSVDAHFLESLTALVSEFDLTAVFTKDDISEISRQWHFLIPWPDAEAGLRALNALDIQTCSLSNANASLLEDLVRFAELPFAHNYSADMFQAYKPDPRMYNGAVQKLGLKAEECAMVAAHMYDLKAARDCGMRTIYVERKDEEDMDEEGVEEARGWVDLWIGWTGAPEGGFVELARKLEGGH